MIDKLATVKVKDFAQIFVYCLLIFVGKFMRRWFVERILFYVRWFWRFFRFLDFWLSLENFDLFFDLDLLSNCDFRSTFDHI